MIRFLFVTIVLLTNVFATPLRAQENAKPTDETTSAIGKPRSPSGEQTSAPYDDKLLRLSEVLGSIHYLRALCKAGEGDKWRSLMQRIISSEKPQPSREARLIARFNRGYGAFDQTYGSCTASALTAADRYMKEGVLLSSQITTRYGR